MKLISLLLALFLMVGSVHAQVTGWCGYVLIEGIPLLRNQLSVLEALTPERHERSMPHELFQVRFNLSHTAVLVEGCWKVEPNRTLLVALLPQTVDDSRIASRLLVTIFGRGASRDAGAALVRAYLTTNAAAWEEGKGP